MMKECSICSLVKPIGDFYKRKDSPDGHASRCKGCHKNEVRKYQKNNREKVKARHRAYYRDNKEKVLKSVRDYQERNSDEIRERRKKRYSENREAVLKERKEFRSRNLEKIREYDRRRYTERADEVNEYCREWRRANAWKMNHYASKRRAARIQATPEWADEDTIKLFYECRPAGCHVDHVIPLRGEHVCGLHVPENLQWLPAEMNLSKGRRLEE